MISILFTQKDSIYNQLCQDCWDKERDATTWPGGNSIIAHPPCRAWGSYKYKSLHSEKEKQLTPWAIEQANIWGGIVEHPKTSAIWEGKHADLSRGFIWSIDQHWFGHDAKKPTYLYIVGIKPNELPAYPLNFNATTRVIEKMSKKQREHTPEALAIWLIKTANIIESLKTHNNVKNQ